MTPNNPAPRPLLEPLWRENFDAREFQRIETGRSYACREDILTAIKIVNKEGKQLTVWQQEESFNKIDLVEKNLNLKAINAIYKALHPPLCMKHALEVVDGKPRYEFRDKQLYAIIYNGKLEHQLGDDIAYWPTELLNEISSFYPCDKYGRPTHGEAEAVVKAWKEGE